MQSQQDFARRIQERYPEGLTGLFAIGGTRTLYILEHNRHHERPGEIADFQHYADYLLERYFQFCDMFIALGGRNLVITALGFRSFFERGETYGHFIAQSTLSLAGDRAVHHYRRLNADPYFVGIDTLLLLPAEHPAHKLGAALDSFQRNWEYGEGRNKIFWEIAAIPLYTFWEADTSPINQDSRIQVPPVNVAVDMAKLHETLYAHYARAGYGTLIPQPHFYLGTNRNGDLKLRSVLPAAFIPGSACRFYYTPYPSLMMPPEAMQRMLEDLAFGEQKLRSQQMDYRDKYTPELAQAEYDHFSKLSSDPHSVLGLSRRASGDFDDG